METASEGKRSRCTVMTPDNLHPLPRVIRLSQIPPKIEMTIFPADRLFIEAAQSPKHCDRLLKRLKRNRVEEVIIILLIASLAIAGLWFELSRFTRFFDVIANSTLNAKTPEVPELSTIGYLSIALTFTLLFEIGMLFHTDTCVKMILILQQQQSVENPAGASPAN